MPGGERDRVVGVKPHDRAAQRRGEAGRHEHGALVHPGHDQDRRVDEDDVGHRQERGEARHQLGLDAGALLPELEEVVQHVGPPFPDAGPCDLGPATGPGELWFC